MTALDPPHGTEEGLVSPLGLDLAALSAHLDATVAGRSGPLRATLLSGGRSNLTYHMWDDVAHWALRRPPLGNLTPSAHDMRREYRVVAALHDTAIPVAEAVVYCDDPAVLGVPFAMVSLVDGVVLRSRADLAPYSDADVRRCAENLLRTLAQLHAVDHRTVGLEQFGRPEGYLRRQVDRWRGQWERVRTRPLPDLDALHSRLDTAVPVESDASIVHGDARIDNFVVDPDDIGVVRALLDWEMATLGGSAAAASDRMPGGDEMIEIYAHESGRDIVNMDFYLALGYFKLVVIAESIHARHLAGNTVGEGFDLVGQAVPALAAGGLRALAG